MATDRRVRQNGTLLGAMTPGGEKHKWFVKRVGKPRRDGQVRAVLEGHLPGVGGTLVRAELDVYFPQGRVDGDEWKVVGPDGDV